MKNPNPECPREDCKFSIYHKCQPLCIIYDKDGKDTNPYGNTTTFKVNCVSCGKIWRGNSCLDETTYEEVKK
jgi:hypothetical protein